MVKTETDFLEFCAREQLMGKVQTEYLCPDIQERNAGLKLFLPLI